MEKEGSITERVLKLTLEIICLLTGENCLAFKLSDGLIGSNLLNPQSPVVDPPSHFLRQNKKSIEEIMREITELLMGEFPIECLEDTVYFSMEEWEHIEGHKDLYKDVMMEDRPPLTSPDGSSNRNTPERCPRPLYSQDSTQEHQEIPQDDQATLDVDETDCITEAAEEKDETYVMGDEPCKEEEIPPEINTDPRDTQRDVKAEEEINVNIKEEDVPTEISTDLGDTRAAQRTVKVEEVEGEIYVLVKEEEVPVEIRTGSQYGKCITEKHLVIVPSDQVDDDLTSDSSSSEDPMTPNLHPACPIADLNSNSSTRGGSVPDIHHLPHQEKRFLCPECGICFPSESSLLKHSWIKHKEKKLCSSIKRETIHTRQRSFVCSECGRSFAQKFTLDAHKRIHTGEKPFSCPECGRSFIQKATLFKHLRTHTGLKPYPCSDCGKCFAQKANLIVHQRTHTGEKPYSCPECGKCFSQNRSLVQHQRRHVEWKELKGHDRRGSLDTTLIKKVVL